MNSIIGGVLKNPLLIMVLGVLVIAAGYYSYRQLPIDAFPDVSPSLVQVFTVTEGLAPEEVEKYVTYPVEVALNGIPNLKNIRSVSNFGLSVVNVYFVQQGGPLTEVVAGKPPQPGTQLIGARVLLTILSQGYRRQVLDGAEQQVIEGQEAGSGVAGLVESGARRGYGMGQPGNPIV